MIKFSATISAIGALVSEFCSAGIMVFFGQNAPDELRSFAILHDGGTLISDVVVGDVFYIGDERFTVLAVGEVANQNLCSLGHFVIKFNGEKTPEMPGDICVEMRPLPHIAIGETFGFASDS